MPLKYTLVTDQLWSPLSQLHAAYFALQELKVEHGKDDHAVGIPYTVKPLITTPPNSRNLFVTNYSCGSKWIASHVYKTTSEQWKPLYNKLFFSPQSVRYRGYTVYIINMHILNQLWGLPFSLVFHYSALSRQNRSEPLNACTCTYTC